MLKARTKRKPKAARKPESLGWVADGDLEEVEDAGKDEPEGEEEEKQAEVDENQEVDLEEEEPKEEKKASIMVTKPIRLDVGLGWDDLYLKGESLAFSGDHAPFDTSALSSHSKLRFEEYESGLTPAVPSASSRPREVRGAAVRPVDDTKIRRKEAKLAREERLEKWFGLPKTKMTPELAKELKVIKLRANYDPKRFYKANDSAELPKYFVMASEVGGGLAPAGLRPTLADGPKRGRTLLDSILRDQKAQEWTSKRTHEVQERQAASRFSGHGKPRTGEASKKTRRGGAWKKKQR